MTTSKRLVLVKLGGSVITEKSKPFTLRPGVLGDLVGQVKRAWDEGVVVVLGHGQGSFGHVPAAKYRTIEGNVGGESVYGAAVVEDAAARLNRIVVEECLKQGLPAVSGRPCSFMCLDGNEVRSFVEPLCESLGLGFLPVVHGDVVMDLERGFTIWSTEQVLNYLVGELSECGYQTEKVIHCGEVEGFLMEGKVVPEINGNNFEEIKESVVETAGFDVTGGMLHKIQEALSLAENGVDSYIIGGKRGDNLYKAIVGDEFVGTRVTSVGGK